MKTKSLYSSNMNYHQDYLEKNITFFRLIMRVNFTFAIMFYVLQIRIMNNNNKSMCETHVV